jgi:hypothetical protein
MSVDGQTMTWMREVLADALRSPRLTEWERAFCTRITALAIKQGAGMSWTENQQQTLLRIEEKIYACG